MLAPARRGGEMVAAAGMQRQEIGHELRADLVIGAADGGADGGDDAGRVGAEGDHGGDGVADNAIDGAAPAGMGGADDAGFGIGEENRGAIGGEDAQRNAGEAGDHGVGFDAGAGKWARDGDDAVGMDLLRRMARSWPAKPRARGDEIAVGGDIGRIVAAGIGDVEGGKDAARLAALAAEKAVANMGQAGEGRALLEGGRHGSNPGG